MKFEDLVLGSDFKNIYFLINKDYKIHLFALY